MMISADFLKKSICVDNLSLICYLLSIKQATAEPAPAPGFTKI